MKALAIDKLNTNLEDANDVASIFSSEDIAEMWIYHMLKEEVESKYIDENGWSEVLGSKRGEKGESVYLCLFSLG